VGATIGCLKGIGRRANPMTGGLFSRAVVANPPPPRRDRSGGGEANPLPHSSLSKQPLT